MTDIIEANFSQIKIFFKATKRMSLRLSRKKNKKSSRLLSKRRKIQLGVSPKKRKMLSR